MTRRLLALALRRRAWCAAAFGAMLLAGVTESAPIFLAKFYVEKVLFVAPSLGAPEPEPGRFTQAALEIGRRFVGPTFEAKEAALLLVVCAILFTAVFASIATYATTYLARALSAQVVTELRVMMMERVLRAPLAFFTRRKLGDIQSRFTNDAGLTANTVDLFLSEVLLQPVVILFGAASAFWINWRLALAGFLFLPLVVVPVMRLGRQVQRRAKRTLEAMGAATESVGQTLSGVRIIKAFGAESLETARFQAINSDWRARSLKTVRARALGRGIMDLTYGLVLATTLGAGGWLVSGGHWNAKPEEFIAFLVALGVILQPLKRVVSAFHTWSEALAGAKRLFEVVDLEPEAPDRPNARHATPVKKGVRFEGVSFSYPDTPDQPVLDEVTFEIPAGRTVALVGPSGAGKSTTADLLLRFYDPVRGRVLVDDAPLADLRRSSLLEQIAVVSQQPFVFNMTVGENIRYGRPEATDAEVHAAAKAALVDEFLPQLPHGIDTLVGDRGASLSGGQLQRITIARALLKNASVLILDEATSNLDARSEALVQQALFNLVQGRTALIIAHRLSTVERADEIIVLDRGRIVERGKHAALLTARGPYWRLQQAQLAA